MDTKRDIRDQEELKLRSVPVRISDKDLKALSEKCGRSGITVQELFETFVGDLICGSFYSGSDESMYADQWYDRHGFSWMYEDDLLPHLLGWGSADSVDEFLTAWDERAYFKDHPEEIDPEDQWWEDEIKEALEGFKREPTENDIKCVREWLEEFRRLSDSSEEVG